MALGRIVTRFDLLMQVRYWDHVLMCILCRNRMLRARDANSRRLVVVGGQGVSRFR